MLLLRKKTSPSLKLVQRSWDEGIAFTFMLRSTKYEYISVKSCISKKSYWEFEISRSTDKHMEIGGKRYLAVDKISIVSLEIINIYSFIPKHLINAAVVFFILEMVTSWLKYLLRYGVNYLFSRNELV